MLRAPRHLPSLEMLLADVRVPRKDLARHLGVNERTIRAWVAAGTAPRPVLLALYWETRWGQDNAIADAHNTIQVHRRHAESLARELQRVSMQNMRLAGLVDDSANSPLFNQA